MLLNWIRTKLWQRRRLIFRYHDGESQRAADPVEIAIALHGHTEFLYRHLEDAAEGDKDAQQVVARAACDAFGVEPLSPDGSYGLTVAERIELVMAFDLFLMKLKKNTVHSQTLATSMESTSSNSDGKTTNSTLDSGSTENE